MPVRWDKVRPGVPATHGPQVPPGVAPAALPHASHRCPAAAPAPAPAVLAWRRMAHVDSERSTETGTAGPGAPAPLRGAATPPPDDDSTVSLPGNARPLRTVAGDAYVIE